MLWYYCFSKILNRDHLLVISSPICEYGHIYEYGHQMVLKSRSKTIFCNNFRCLIRSRDQMDARTLSRGPKLVS